jgi:hypothetical protein
VIRKKLKMAVNDSLLFISQDFHCQINKIDALNLF